jgi:hypothetical protein
MSAFQVKKKSNKNYDKNRLLKKALINSHNNNNNSHESQINESIKRLVLSLFFVRLVLNQI